MTKNEIMNALKIAGIALAAFAIANRSKIGMKILYNTPTA
jgi:hypothetical protein